MALKKTSFDIDIKYWKKMKQECVKNNTQMKDIMTDMLEGRYK